VGAVARDHHGVRLVGDPLLLGRVELDDGHLVAFEGQRPSEVKADLAGAHHHIAAFFH